MHRFACQVFAFLIASFIGLSAAAQQLPGPLPKPTAEQQERLKERRRLVGEANKLQNAGKLFEARAIVEKLLAIEREVFGDTDTDVAESLGWLIDLSIKLEDFTAARTYAEKALAVRKKLYGESQWQTTDSRLKLDDVELRAKLTKEQRADLAEAERLKWEYLQHNARGEFQNAIELAEKARILFKAVLGVKHPDYAASLNNLAFLYRAQGLYAKAEPLYQQALAICKEVLGVKHPDYASSLNNLALLYDSQGLYAKAEPLYQQALAIRKEVLGVKHPDYASSLNNLAFLYASQGLHAKAEPLYQQALAIRKEVLGIKHPDYAVSLSNLASLYKSQGLYVKAEPLYQQALAIHKEVLGVKHPDYATSLNNLALLYDSQGLYAKAEPLYLEALAIKKEVLGIKHRDHSKSLNNLASLYLAQGLYAKAEPLYLEALAIHKEVLGVKHPDYATSLHNLALLYYSQGLYAKAEPLCHQALAIRKEVLGIKHPDYADSLNNLAALYDSQGLYAKAEPVYLEALAIKKEVLGIKHPDYADSLNNLAALYDSQGLYAKAEPLYLEALANRKEVLGIKHPHYATSLNNLAFLYYSQGLHARAEPLYQQAIGIIEEHLEETAAIESEWSQLIYIAATRYYLDNLLLLKETAPAAVYATAFRWRGAVTARQAFARAYARTVRDIDAGKPILKTIEELRAVSFQLANLAGTTPKPGADLAALQQDLSAKREMLEQMLARQSKDFTKYQQYRKLTPSDLQIELPADAVLIDFFAYGDKIAAFIITPKTIVRVDLKGGKDLAEMVREFRGERSLKRTRPVNGEEDTNDLYNAVWAPLLPHVGDAKLILVCPDGPLCQLPFAALRGKDPKKYLIEEVAIAIVPVPRMLPELLAGPREKPASPLSLLAIGDVEFGPGRPWKPLAGTKPEIETIEKLFRQNATSGLYHRGLIQSLTKGDATKVAVGRNAAKYRYLHFATHGFFDAPLPHPKFEGRGFDLTGNRERIQINPNLLCGLVCAGANNPTPNNDGRLTALEIMELDLSGVELAVLSACETGLGEIKRGDGVFGLQRAFQLAGARTTVTSLWQVHDQATSSLMIRFYENKLKKRMPTLEALHEAQLWVLNNGVEAGALSEAPKNGRRTPPLYWAAFALAGDWR